MAEPQPERRRVILRLKHSLAADEEINLVLPDDLERLEAEFAEAEPLGPGARIPDDAGNLEGATMSDGLNKLKESGLAPDVIEARGYERYESAADVVAVDPRMGSVEPIGTRRDGKPRTLANWTKHYGARGPGWVMPKHKLPGSAFDDPLPQLRPDVPAPDYSEAVTHEHSWAFLNRPIARVLHEEGKAHVTIPVKGRHQHVPEGKYLIPPGAHGKRWDANPICADRWTSAERVFLHLEGCIKADALASRGEAAADVPSVTLWDRAGAVSWLDWPGGKPAKPKPEIGGSAGDFWDEYEASTPAWEAWDAEMEQAQKRQEDELIRFLTEHVHAPVIVVCDGDWRWKPEVATEAFCLRDVVRARTDLPCVVAAPPMERKDAGFLKGTDDFLAAGHAVEEHHVVEPRESAKLAAFITEYERAQRRAGRVTRERLARDVELLRWYATHAIAEGFVKRKPAAIGRRVGVKSKAVRQATVRLREAGALEIVEGYYADPADDDPERRGGGHSPAASLRVREDLRPQAPGELLSAWLRRQS